MRFSRVRLTCSTVFFTDGSLLRVWARTGLFLGAATLLAAPGVVSGQGYSRPVVQALPDPEAARLSEALRRLSREPQSVEALVDAGRASLSLDDIEAADGFFRRAEAVSPADGRVKAGLASVMVRRQQPVEALRYFAEAEQAGETMQIHGADRGLAYDLVGDNAKAQEEYRRFLALGEDPLVTRRLALSQAIAGDQRASEATLLPLLQRQDLAAYRARAFALAILGKPEEAVSIAETMLPERISSRMAPYLRYMPRLTRAQQAAAANLGAFPQAASIGRDDPALAAFTPPASARVPVASADARLVPQGEPLGTVTARAEPSAPGDIPSASPPAALVEASLTETLQAPEVVALPAAAPVGNAPLAAAAVTEPADEAALVAAPVPPRPAIDLAQAEPAPPPVEEVDLVQAFADFSLPVRPTVSEGAVDITRITPPRERPQVEPAAAPEPPKPVHPSRHWVQVATGRDTGALAFDWRRIKRQADGLLDKPAPHVAAWGQTNRLVAGPFDNAREANDLVTKLKEKNVDSFRFTSAQGEEVKPLS